MKRENGYNTQIKGDWKEMNLSLEIKCASILQCALMWKFNFYFSMPVVYKKIVSDSTTFIM